MTVDLVLSNTKAYINGGLIECSMAIDQGRISKIGNEPNMPKADLRLDLKKLLVLPGLIDTHVHLRDEKKSHKEDFYSGTAAAAAGGITTVLDMPNNDPVTMSVETLRNRTELAEGKVVVNVGFYSEFPQNTQEIERITQAGAMAFKLFMAEQIGGLDPDDDRALLDVLRVTSQLKILVAVHAEDRKSLKKTENKLKCSDRNDIDAFLEAHSVSIEQMAIERLLNAVKRSKAHVHFCHVSTENGLNALIQAKESGLPVTCEATPHHLLLSSIDLKRIGTLALTMPPVREKRHIAALWDGVKKGRIDSIGSDHAPHTLKEKKSECVWDVKVGIPGLETTLPLLLTEVNKRRLTVADLVRLMSEKPAEIFGLEGRGCLREGNCADITVVDLDREFKIDSSKFHSKAKFSPFDGRIVKGKPVKTFVNGKLIMDEGEIVAKAVSGRIIRRR